MKNEKLKLKNISFLQRAESDALLDVAINGFDTQRTLADRIGVSLGKANGVIRSLQSLGLLSTDNCITEAAKSLIAAESPKRAVILAAGSGLRMAPLNNLPKGLLVIHGEALIERLIRQLNDVGVYEIYMVVGFLKEKYAYLENKYGIRLIYNAEYSTRNTLWSLSLACNKLSNCYIAPSDYYCLDNPFSPQELYSWYMLSDKTSVDGEAVLNRGREIIAATDNRDGLPMIGIAYLQGDASIAIARELKIRSQMKSSYLSFWETVILDNAPVRLNGKIVDQERYSEINTFEDLRSLNYDERQLNSKAINIIRETFNVDISDICGVELLKRGMTNRSFLFKIHNEKFIMRIPGEGSSQLINRQAEFEAYQAVKGLGLSDDIVFISPDDGYKIARFWDDARVCDPSSSDDVGRCMGVLRAFHKMNLSVPKKFDIFTQVLYYESLLKGTPSIFLDYEETKENVLSLKEFIDGQRRELTLTHIDAVPDNFLFTGEQIRLIDWEYAAMCDPHVDIAMFAIYAMYERDQVEALIDTYFIDGCTNEIRAKIYCYIAACGLLWSNWCEFKRLSGVEFGEYSLRQYLFAKDYYSIAIESINKLRMEHNGTD